MFEKLWDGLEGGQQRALGKKLWLAGGGKDGGQDAIEAVLRGDLEVRLEPAVRSLVDTNGRAIPPRGITNEVVNAATSFKLIQPEINLAFTLARLQESFPLGTKFLSVAECAQKLEVLLAQIDANKQVNNLRKGVWLPVPFPQFEVAEYGTSLENTFLAGLERSYQRQFPDRQFYNYREGELAGQVTVVDESRHQDFIAAMRAGPGLGVYFVPLQGYSIPADREVITSFPQGFTLSGAIDTALALTAYPEVLARDYNVPALDCAANNWRSPGGSLYFCAGDDKLFFRSGGLNARGSCSGGVLFLG